MAKTSKIVRQTKHKVKYTVRLKNRCKLCGRPRSYMRMFGLCRLCFRELADRGEMPGDARANPIISGKYTRRVKIGEWKNSQIDFDGENFPSLPHRVRFSFTMNGLAILKRVLGSIPMSFNLKVSCIFCGIALQASLSLRMIVSTFSLYSKRKSFSLVQPELATAKVISPFSKSVETPRSTS